MSLASSAYKRALKGVKAPFKRFKLWVKQLLGWLDKPCIAAFRGFASEDYAVARGVLMEDKGLRNPEKSNKRWRNMLDMLKRYSGDTLPNVRLKISFGNEVQEVVTDEQGTFKVEFELQAPPGEHSGWYPYTVEVLDEVVEEQGQVKAEGEVLFVRKGARFSDYGIVSDIDDTVLVSHSLSTIKKLRLMLFKNAQGRLPFEGVDRFYKLLSEGSNGQRFNPIFFVSSSEWNLYDLLIDFFRIHDIPKGPLLLQRLRTSLWQLITSGGGSHEHKHNKISDIMRTYPQLNFILIGDSGQRDPEIYSRIVDEFPGRIKAIYIRDVTKEKRDWELRRLQDKLKLSNVEMLLISHTREAVAHAAAHGYIQHSKAPEEVAVPH